MYQKFIGIDIGKESFYVGTHGDKTCEIYKNTDDGFSKFHQVHQEPLKKGLVIIETTGGYEKPLIRFLQKRNYCVHRANTRKVKHFIRSYGQLGKSDAIDALGLAHYGYERHESLPLFIENKGESLRLLVGRRSDLKRMIVQEKNRLKAPEQSEVIESFEAVIEMLNRQIQLIDEKIEAVMCADETLCDKREVLKSIAGVGDIIATQLLALMPELGTVNRKQIASLGGVAPHPNESGKWVGHRFTRGGRCTVKPILFMAAMTAARSHTALGEFYQKLLAAGKKKMVALTALMRKILVIANAKLRDYYTASVLNAT